MAFEWKLVNGGRINTDTPAVTMKYRAEGLPSFVPGGDFFDYVARNAMSKIPRTFQHPRGTLYRQDIQIHEDYYARKYSLTVPYGLEERQTGAYQITVDQTGGMVHVTAGKRIAGYAVVAGDIEDNEGIIGKDGDQIHGVDIPVEQTQITVNFRHPSMWLNRAYINRIGKLVGFPNADAFLGYEPGEVLFQGGRFNESNSESSAQYGFAVSYNRSNFEVGGITVSDKKGWDVISPVYTHGVDTNGHGIRKLKCIEIVRPAGREWVNYKSSFGWG